MNIKKYFKAPQCYFTVPLIVPLALLLCIFIGYYNRQYNFEYYPPLPSSIIVYTPQNIIYGISVVIACIFMGIGIYKNFRYLNSSHRVGLQSITTKMFVYVCVGAGATSVVSLLLMSLFSIADGLWIHFSFHFVFFTTLMIYLGVTDYLFNLLKFKHSLGHWILDGVIFAIYLFYFIIGYIMFFRPPSSFFSLISLAGHALFILVFIKFHINGTILLRHILVKRN